MYRILIVDDEAVVREGIRDNMNWNDIGFELVGDCENGSEAIEAVEKFQPDVVLTDICMPFVDGLELARYISERYPRIKVIILTGYDEFEYARQAVKLKAWDFLIKPITAGELRKILDKVRNQLDKEAKSMEDLERLKRQLKESLPLLKERFLNRLISGHLREGELEEKLKYFNIQLPGSYYLAFVVDIDDCSEPGSYLPGMEDELFFFAVFNICEEIVGRENSGIAFQNRNGKTIGILTGNDVYSLNESALGVCEELRQSVEKYMKFTVTVGIGIVSSGLSNIYESYKSAVSALDYRFLLGKNHVINITDMERNTASYTNCRKQWEKKLVSALKTGTEEEIGQTMENIVKDLRLSYTSVEKCYIRIQQIVAYITNTIDELGVDERDIFGSSINPFTDIYSFKTLDEIEVWLKKLCKKVIDYIADKRNDFCRIQVLKAEEYIKNNYHDPGISLNTLCKHLFISTSYFSMIFKNKTGETFVEYLTRIRVEKSMEYLKNTTLKTYEIAEKVGYTDPHYFSLIFKKTTGSTPTEYRERTRERMLDD